MDNPATIIVIAEITALPGKEAELRQAINSLIPPSIAENDGSAFRLQQDLDVPGHFILYERFADQAALESLFNISHLKKMFDYVAPLGVGAKLKMTKQRQWPE